MLPGTAVAWLFLFISSTGGKESVLSFGYLIGETIICHGSPEDGADFVFALTTP